ncbi:MAG TPA: WHG domain-containing protein [Jiangellaceae bacterium]
MPTPARTSLEEIVKAGRSIVEATGLESLTMQRVAAAVGVKAPSLYKRVQNRDTLVRLVVEGIAGEIADRLDAAASTGDALEDLRSMAHALRAYAHAHPTAYGLLFAQLPIGARPDLEHLARTSAAIVRTTTSLAGPDVALEAARTVVAWAHGFISMELGGAFRLGGDVDRAYAFGIERLGAALAR